MSRYNREYGATFQTSISGRKVHGEFFCVRSDSFLQAECHSSPSGSFTRVISPDYPSSTLLISALAPC
jgi:hypothetical protein